ncbi:EF-hand calcium-binding domain-containing protein 14 isoform X2 [Brienomyrus brachyistius]|uniref:EF-hand calcium-binding domain-containing protein 14 isoform X2 n=1 Tax=Brienomyrus brachyistius TaxID=42636 RepID=UPI0020B30E04|nr:EF-hand calcium-binding domain-containing protein 14 isoform X2 [Brienomyrus brachyistius]
MKKRKELNALIGLGGDGKRKKTKKCSGHRLLRTEPPGSDSESSSDDDEFNSAGGVSAFGKSYTQCCSICFPLCAFIVLVACVMACAGLIWMQIALKEDLDTLKEKLHAMEASQSASSHEIPKLSDDLKEEFKKLELLENGDRGLNKLWSNLTEINRKINLLDSAVNHLKTNIKSASDLISLPTTVEELQKSVATIGSTLTSVQHDVRTVQTAVEDHRKAVDDLKNAMVENRHTGDARSSSSSTEKANGSCTPCVPLKQDALSESNGTQIILHGDERIRNLSAAISSLTQKVSFLESGFLLLNVTPPSHRPMVPEPQPQNRSKMGLGSEDTGEVAGAPPAGREKAEMVVTDATEGSSQPTRRPRFLSQRISKKELSSDEPVLAPLPGITSLKDLEDLFHSSADASSQGLSYSDLKNILGDAVPDSRLWGRCDKDGNERLTLSELQCMTGL